MQSAKWYGVHRWYRRWHRLVGSTILGTGIAAVQSVSAQSIPEKFSDAEQSQQVPGGQQHTVIQSTKKRITLVATDRTVKELIHEIARQANLHPIYDNNISILKQRISVSLKNASVIDAFKAVLQGSDLVARVKTDGRTLMIGPSTPGRKDSLVQAESGTITGTVLDSSSGKSLIGATVTRRGSSVSILSDQSGKFVLRGVPAGEHIIQVKLFGYRIAVASVQVEPKSSVNVNIRLIAVPTSLSEVVTTVTGEQRKIEVGNDITTVKVDSLLKLVPVNNVSELLATRVPGLVAVPTSGAPGAPTKIRIRGLSSISASNDPIIIVDGIRVASEQVQNSRSLLGRNQADSYLASTPLDLIDVNNIETIEVLKGPSAVALYGSDAANGVIIINTKRGQVGPTRWSGAIKYGTESQPGKWPVNYRMWGHLVSDPLTPIGCSTENQVTGTCIADSLATYQMLGIRDRTVLGRGSSRTYSGSVNGGVSGMTYAVTGSVSDIVGLLKMPNLDQALLALRGEPASSSQKRPQSNKMYSGGVNLSMNVFKSSTVVYSGQLMNGVTSNSPLAGALSWAKSPSSLGDSVSTGLLNDISNFRARVKIRSTKTTNKIDINSNFLSNLTTQVTVGADLFGKQHDSRLGAGECYVVSSRCPNDGDFRIGHGQQSVVTTNIRASYPFRLGRLVSFGNSTGINYVRETGNDLVRSAQGLPFDATTGNNAERIEVTETKTDRITAGIYFESRVGIADRWYIPIAIRQDAGSALGSSIMPKFPKLSLSYILSDDAWFQRLPGTGVVSLWRVRGAYGHAGNQPLVSQRVRSYERFSDRVDGVPVTYVNLFNVGNTQLKPERTKELEYGMDIELLNGRISATATLYKKRTNDMLMELALPPSLASGKQQYNLGDIQNTGFEFTASVVPVETRALRYSTEFQISHNSNRLLRTNASTAKNINGNTAIVGYPLYAYWIRPVVGFADVNNDGIISKAEVMLSDSAVYAGSPSPKVIINAHNMVTAFRNFSFVTTFQYEGGITQNQQPNSATNRATQDPLTPQLTQVQSLWSELHRIQSVSLLRFQTASLVYTLPRVVSNRLLPNRSISIGMDGTNLYYWSNYRGKDPKVNADMSEVNYDNGATLPQPRKLGLSVRIN